MRESERLCYEALRQLRLDYERAAKPYVDMLVYIHALRPAPRLLMLTANEALATMEIEACDASQVI